MTTIRRRELAQTRFSLEALDAFEMSAVSSVTSIMAHVVLPSGKRAIADVSAGTDVSLHIDAAAADAVSAFSIPRPVAEPLRFGSWVGDVSCGSSVNCFNVMLCAHGAGTHTECVGHALAARPTLFKEVAPPAGLCTALLVSVAPVPLVDVGAYPPGKAGDLVVSVEALTAAVDAALAAESALAGDASGDDKYRLLNGASLLLRTLPNSDAKRTGERVRAPCRSSTAPFCCLQAGPCPAAATVRRVAAKYSGTNPPYVTPGAMSWLVECGVAHIVLDLPSVDREVRQGGTGGLVVGCTTTAQGALPPPAMPPAPLPLDPQVQDDGGHLLGHRAFWQMPPKADDASVKAPYSQRTITELAFFPPDLGDGLYLINHGVAPIAMDAAPSRPVVFKLTASA